MGSVLALEPRARPVEGLDAAQLGTLYHHIFEQLYRTVADPSDLEQLLAALPGVAAPILDAAPREQQFRPTAWWARTRDEIVENVRRSLIALDALREDFVPYAYEARFGLESYPALVIRDGADSFRLRGLIDRVDARRTGVCASLIGKIGKGASAFTTTNVVQAWVSCNPHTPCRARGVRLRRDRRLLPAPRRRGQQLHIAKFADKEGLHGPAGAMHRRPHA